MPSPFFCIWMCMCVCVCMCYFVFVADKLYDFMFMASQYAFYISAVLLNACMYPACTTKDQYISFRFVSFLFVYFAWLGMAIAVAATAATLLQWYSGFCHAAKVSANVYRYHKVVIRIHSTTNYIHRIQCLNTWLLPSTTAKYQPTVDTLLNFLPTNTSHRINACNFLVIHLIGKMDQEFLELLLQWI